MISYSNPKKRWIFGNGKPLFWASWKKSSNSSLITWLSIEILKISLNRFLIPRIEAASAVHGTIILFANGMFTADLMHSNRKLWKYNLIWQKTQPTGFLNAKKMPLRSHCGGPYNPWRVGRFYCRDFRWKIPCENEKNRSERCFWWIRWSWKSLQEV